jgi:hypothetical protein
MGFVHIGTLKEVGRKFDRLIGVHILQKMLGRAALTTDKLSETSERTANPQLVTRNP